MQEYTLHRVFGKNYDLSLAPRRCSLAQEAEGASGRLTIQRHSDPQKFPNKIIFLRSKHSEPTRSQAIQAARDRHFFGPAAGWRGSLGWSANEIVDDGGDRAAADRGSPPGGLTMPSRARWCAASSRGWSWL